MTLVCMSVPPSLHEPTSLENSRKSSPTDWFLRSSGVTRGERGADPNDATSHGLLSVISSFAPEQSLTPTCSSKSTTEMLLWCLVGSRSFRVRRHAVLARTHCSANVPTWVQYLQTSPVSSLSRRSKLTWSSARSIVMIATTTTLPSMTIFIVVACL